MDGIFDLLDLLTYTEDFREMEHSYDFVSKEEDVDYVRIVRETPAGTPFILVEERTRNSHKPFAWSLFVHNDILSRDSLREMFLGCFQVSPDWGYSEILNLGRTNKLFSYRAIGGIGKFPGYIKQEIEAVKRKINPKNTLTTVTYS